VQVSNIRKALRMFNLVVLVRALGLLETSCGFAIKQIALDWDSRRA
jgi:hypothetical protein